MKNKTISIVLICSLAYALPLAISINLFFSIQPILLALFASIRLLTQLPLPFLKIKEKKTSAKFHVNAILFGFLINLLVCVVELAYFPKPFHYFTIDGFAFGGVFLIL